jgi:hypothetical protein
VQLVCAAVHGKFLPHGQLKAGYLPEDCTNKATFGAASTPGGMSLGTEALTPFQRLLPLDPLGAAYVRSDYFPDSGPPSGKRKADGLELKIK